MSTPPLTNSVISKAAADPKKTVFIIDGHDKAPTGFGLKITPNGHKSYFLQRRHGVQVKRIVIGSIDSITLDEARKKAYIYAQQMAEGVDPKKALKSEQLSHKASVASWTIDRVFEHYEERLKIAQKRESLKDNTAASIRLARTKLNAIAGWDRKPMQDFSPQEVLSTFIHLMKTPVAHTPRKTPEAKVSRTRRVPTATRKAPPRAAYERAFTWIATALDQALEAEAFEKGKPSLVVNPFRYLAHTKALRTKSELEKERLKKRHPLSEQRVGEFIDLLWSKRANRQTGVDYLLLTLLWGSRADEGCKLQWVERIEGDPLRHSFVDLDGIHTEIPCAFFHDTKNNTDHVFPLTPRAQGLLRQRRAESQGSWVFPALSSRAKKPYYSDARTLIDYLELEMNITLSRHDLRRTFGRIAESMDLSTETIKRLLNHATGEVTNLYTTPDRKRVLHRLQLIEDKMLSNAPTTRAALDAWAFPSPSDCP